MTTINDVHTLNDSDAATLAAIINSNVRYAVGPYMNVKNVRDVELSHAQHVVKCELKRFESLSEANKARIISQCSALNI